MITEMLGMYQAELARVLGVRCGDIGDLANARRTLEPGSEAWQRAIGFVRLYEALFEKTGGEGPAMCHWLRADHPDLGGVPLLLMVDDGRLMYVVDYLESQL